MGRLGHDTTGQGMGIWEGSKRTSSSDGCVPSVRQDPLGRLPLGGPSGRDTRAHIDHLKLFQAATAPTVPAAREERTRRGDQERTGSQPGHVYRGRGSLARSWVQLQRAAQGSRLFGRIQERQEHLGTRGRGGRRRRGRLRHTCPNPPLTKVNRASKREGT